MIESEATSQKLYAEPSPAFGYGDFQSLVAPTVDDDEIHNFSVNSFWYKFSVPYQLWICTDNTTGAAVWKEIPLSASRSMRALFDRYADATTTGTTQETLYSDEVAAFVLYPEAGDKIFFRYAGKYAANANDNKYLYLTVAGGGVAESGGQAINGEKWEIDGFIIRVSSSVLRYEAEFTATGVTPVLREGEITGLDLNSDPIPFLLDARTIDGAGDVTATMGTAWFMPAAPVVAGDYWTVLTDRWLVNGEPWAFNP